MAEPVLDPTPLSESLFFQMLEEERYRLAQDLQRGPGQVLANAVLELEHSLPLLATHPRDAMPGFESLLRELQDGLEDLRLLVSELQPSLLAELGLVPCLSKYLDSFERRTGITTRFETANFECSGAQNQRLPSTLETALFRIIQESLDNVREHSGAREVTVTLARIGNEIRATVSDNGRGFPQSDTNGKHRPLGLVSMRDRAKLLGGKLQLYSEPQRGVQVVVTIPYHKRNAGTEQARPNPGASLTSPRGRGARDAEQSGAGD